MLFFHIVILPSFCFLFLFLLFWGVFSASTQYAATCAAIQNILLSLHSENIATKWATGPVIQTQAFRNLIHASEYDRIVGLIMIGWSAKSKNTTTTSSAKTTSTTNKDTTTRPRRRFRRKWDDLITDL